MAHCLVEPEEERLEEESQGSCWLSRDSPVLCEQKERASFLIGGNTERTTEEGEPAQSLNTFAQNWTD